jgi:hypothetical protein
MPVSKISDAPASIKELDDVALTLAQINWILNIFDGLEEGDADVESPMAVAVAQFKESFTVEDGKWKKKETTATVSLDRQVEAVRSAFWESDRGVAVADAWPVEIFDDRVIVESDGGLFSAAYSTEEDGTITFAPRSEWQPVERTYTPLSAFASFARRIVEAVKDAVSPKTIASLTSQSYQLHGATGQVYILDGEPGKLAVGDDGLVWKDLLVPGDWFTPDGDPVTVTRGDIENVHAAFSEGSLPAVPIPFGHVEHLGGDDPANNNGFVRELRIAGADGPDSEVDGDFVLWGGLDITEPDTLEKLERGSIGNVSVWLEPDFHDLKDEGTVWPLVLWHVALVDKPQLTPELKPFVAFSVSMKRTAKEVAMSDKEKQELEAQIVALEAEKAELDAEKVRLEALTVEQSEQLAEREREAHEVNVASIVAALQGQGKHEGVEIPDGQMVPPAVLASIQPVLEADAPNGKPRLLLSVTRTDSGGKSEKLDLSATAMVLGVVNAFIASGVTLDTLRRGSTDNADPSVPTAEAKKAKAEKVVADYVEEHPNVVR